MLARASSDAGTRLRRSKSTSTVHKHPPPLTAPLDPDVARQHAVRAAAVAFARSQPIEFADRKSKRSSEMSRSKSNASRKSLTSQGSHFPPRMSSSRSLQAQKAGSNAKPFYPSYTTPTDTEQFPPFFPVTSCEFSVSMLRPSSGQPSTTVHEDNRPRSQPKASRQSASSSVTSQQLRKARSMYYASSVQTGSPIARPPAKYLTTPPPISVTPAPTLESILTRPSTRTVELSPLASARIPVTLAADETLDTARDKYLQGFQQKNIKHKPSISLAPFKKRQEKAKEKNRSAVSTVGTASTSGRRTPVESMADNNLQDFLPQSKVKEKRSFSGSLRSKLKRVFRRTSDKMPNLPVQQIDASRDYFITQQDILSERDDAYAIPSPDEETLQRVRSRNPSEGVHSPSPRCRSRNSSNGSGRSNKSARSLHSEMNATHNSTSRMTSWATSSTGDAPSHGAIKRLTVIHESKDSTGSEAYFMPKRKSLPPPALAAFCDPMPIQGITGDALTSVDPKRVFSALMKEIETTKSPPVSSSSIDRSSGIVADVFEAHKTKKHRSQNEQFHASANPESELQTDGEPLEPSRRHSSTVAQAMQGKTSTMRSLGKVLRSTIRAVTPVERPLSNHPESELLVHGSTNLPTINVAPQKTTPSPDLNQNDQQRPASTSINPAEAECSTVNLDHPIEPFAPSMAQIEKRVERVNDRWKTTLEQTEQPQFPRETARTYNVTNIVKHTVPFETPGRGIAGRAESSRVDNYQNDAQRRGDFATSVSFPMSPSPHFLKSPLSPSIYSRNTDGISILPNESVTSLRLPERYTQRNDEGSAVILTSQSVRSYVVGTPSPRRPESNRVSRDWRDWLSNEISSIDIESQEDLSIHEKFLTPCKEPRRNAMRSSHTEHSETTVILHETSDPSPPIPDIEISSHLQRPGTAEQRSTSVQSQQQYKTKEQMTKAIYDISDPAPKSFESLTRRNNLSPVDNRDMYLRSHSSRSSLTPFPNNRRAPSAAGSYKSSSQPVLETPKSSRMNDRFPFFRAVPTSGSNSTSSSGRSKSPAGSVLSLNSPKPSRPNTGYKSYSNLSAPSTVQTCRRVNDRAAKERELQHHDRKENFTPTGLYENCRPGTSHSFGPSRPATSQSMASAPADCKRFHVYQGPVNASTVSHFKRNSSPAATPPRPFVRVTLHPVSPKKLSRRPKSVYSLRKANQQDMVEASKRSIIRGLATPSPTRRRTGLHLKTSSSSLALNKEPSPGIEHRVIDDVLDDEWSGSITPGQRMVDRFLRERKSASTIEGVKMRGGLKLTREDTPAFL